MTNDNTQDQQISLVLDRAVSQGYISQPQADMLREEMFMFPGGNISSIMVRRGMISAEQAQALEAPAEEQPVSHDDDDDFDFSFGAPDPDAAFVVNPPPSSPVEPPSRPVMPTPPPVRNYQPPPPAYEPAAFKPAESPVEPPAHKPSLRAAIEASQGFAVKKPSQSAAFSPADDLVRLFRAGRERGCSDLHLTVGKPPYFRQQGKLFFMDEVPLSADITQSWSLSVLTEDQRAELDQHKQLDFSFECPGVGRFRANVYQQRLGVEAAFRFIPDTVPTLEGLRLPKVLEKLTAYPQGLNLVTGPGGCGKTTTVAAMLEFVNCHRHDHIITVEDPVEYVFQPKSCQITQREVGTHTGSFANALRTALRQDPDVIMIGELRDLETTSISITAAETGHLVFGTLHTSSAARTVARILDVYPPSQRGQICLMIAESLRGVISQQLIERKDGQGRACAMEILLATTGVAQVIKEGKTHQLVSHMQSGRKLGMVSMDDSLMELVQSGLISGAEGYSRAENKAAFEMLRNER